MSEIVNILPIYGDRVLLQLRDDIIGVPFPGQWGFFGGNIEAGETPRYAAFRELHEELCIEPKRLVFVLKDIPLHHWLPHYVFTFNFNPVLCPMKLTEAIKSRKARVTVGGAPAFVHPSFNIYFRADVERVMPGAFSWVPSPAVVIPTEFTMTLEDYIDIGGYVDAIRPLSEVLKEIKQGKRHEVPELGW